MVRTADPTMSDTTSPQAEDAARLRAENFVRAAGVASIIAGVLFAAMAMTFTRVGAVELDLGTYTIAEIAVAVLGVLTLRSQTWSMWATIAIATAFLGGELWLAYGFGRTPQGRTLSVFLLVVPLILLVFNALAVGAARGLMPKRSRPET